MSKQFIFALLFTYTLCSGKKGFGDTCIQIKVNQYTLSAACERGDKGIDFSSLDLNVDFFNDDGQITYNPGVGGFSKTCDTCRVNREGKQILLRCICAKTDGTKNEPAIDLNQYIGNQDGKLEI
jgi:hypothetical protein